MGSSLSQTAWVWIAAVSGLLFLIFDASRYFTHQISPMTLRRWSGDPEQEVRGRWLQYDPLNLRLLNGAMLQIALAIALLATVLAFSIRIAAVVWILVILIWKFVLGFIPEDVGETILRLLVPVSRFFYYVFWPVLFPLRRVAEGGDGRGSAGLHRRRRGGGHPRGQRREDDPLRRRVRRSRGA